MNRTVSLGLGFLLPGLFTGCASKPVMVAHTPHSPAAEELTLASVVKRSVPASKMKPRFGYTLTLLNLQAQAINDNGSVCGALTVSKKDPHTQKLYYENGHLALWRNGIVRDLGNIPETDYCIANAVNRRGEIVGAMGQSGLGDGDGPPNSEHIFRWSRGKLHDFGVDGEAKSINEQGQVVGRKNWQDGQFSFLITSGKMLEIKNPYGKQFSQVDGINNKGQMIGFAYGPNTTLSGLGNGKSHILLYSGATATEIPLPRHFILDAQRGPNFNNAGQIIINAMIFTPVVAGKNVYLHDHCYLYQHGKIADLGVLPGFTDMNSVAINDQAEIVGNTLVTGSNYKSHPFLWKRGALYDLNNLAPHPNWTLTTATGLNNRGQIIGQGEGGGKEYNFLLTPVIKQ